MNNLNEKMGFLRNFVKKNKLETNEKRNRKNRIHPKELKILNYYDPETRRFINIDNLIK